MRSRQPTHAHQKSSREGGLRRAGENVMAWPGEYVESNTRQTNIADISNSHADGSGTAHALPPVALQLLLIRLMSKRLTMPSPLTRMCPPEGVTLNRKSTLLASTRTSAST